MTKTEAAKILVTAINVRARHYGVRHVTREFTEIIITEAQGGAYGFSREGSLTWQAARIRPAFSTIRKIAKSH